MVCCESHLQSLLGYFKTENNNCLGEAAVDLSDDDNEDDSTNEDVASDSDQQVALDDSLQQSGSR